MRVSAPLSTIRAYLLPHHRSSYLHIAAATAHQRINNHHRNARASPRAVSLMLRAWLAALLLTRV